MESALTKACTIKLQNFEGPFDLLFHLIEKNKVDIYDIPINEITDQYMEYLFAMQELDLEIASEFLVMASTLLHIKSRMLLPDHREKEEDSLDPREELILSLVEYKRYKEFATELRQREELWEKVYYKLPDVIDFVWQEPILELSPLQLANVYMKLIERCRRRVNPGASRMTQLIQHEKVTLRSKIHEVIKALTSRSFFRFSEIFRVFRRSRAEVVTGFLAILELAKMEKVRLKQSGQFSDIEVFRNTQDLDTIDYSIYGEDK